MSRKKNKKSEDEELVDKVEIVEEKSSLTEFTKRSLPTEEEVEEFDEILAEELDTEKVSAVQKNINRSDSDDDYSSDDVVDDSLNEIYQDDDGKMVDVKKLYIKKRHGFLYWFFALTSLSLILASLLFYVYENYYLNTGTDATAVDFSIKGKTDVLANEEFFYTVTYNNLSDVVLNNVSVELSYPSNFIFIDSEPSVPKDKNNVWQIDKVPAHHIGKIKIKGKLIDKTDTVHVVLANMNYSPENFSSNFAKEASITTVVGGSGLNVDFDYIKTALVGEENEISIKYSAMDENYINDFRIVFNQQENVKIIGLEQASEDKEKQAKFDLIRPGVWRVNEILAEPRGVVFKFDFNEKKNDTEDLTFVFEKKEGDDYLPFLEKKINFQVMKSDLNLALIVNGSREDQGVDAGETLNYSIVYSNNGETEMHNVVIMAVLESEFLDWSTLADKLDGHESGNTIAWTKEQIPELESLSKHDEGTIDFSIALKDIEAINKEKTEDSEFQVSSYVQFSVGEPGNDNKEANANIDENSAGLADSDNHSNTIVNRINSNLKLAESVRYFDIDNNTVGAGPHPPKVGEETRYRVYWDLSNTLHELNNLQVSVEFPTGVTWGAKDTVSVGTIVYDDVSHKTVWNIGRLPATVNEAKAAFDIVVNPVEKDRDKIMILLPGTTVSALDKVTGSDVGETTKAETSKLEDDDIAIGDGVVE